LTDDGRQRLVRHGHLPVNIRNQMSQRLS
jgi:hypothetical protein